MARSGPSRPSRRGGARVGPQPMTALVGDAVHGVGGRLLGAGVLQGVDEDLRDDVVVAFGDADLDLDVAGAVPLGGAADPGGGSRRAVVGGQEEPGVDETVEVEGRQLARDSDLSGGFLPGDRSAGLAHGAIQARPLRVVQGGDCTHSVNHVAESNTSSGGQNPRR